MAGTVNPRNCGPAVVAALTPMTREEAGQALYDAMKREGRKRVAKAVTRKAVQSVLSGFGSVEHTKPEGKAPTLRQWVDRCFVGDPTWTGVVAAANHALAFRDGRCIEDNRYFPSRGRVSWWLTFTPNEPSAPDPVDLTMMAQVQLSAGTLRRLRERVGIDLTTDAAVSKLIDDLDRARGHIG